MSDSVGELGALQHSTPSEVRDPAQAQARLLMKEIFADLKAVRRKNNEQTWARLLGQADRVMDRLAQADKAWAEGKIKQEKRNFQDFLKTAAVASELEKVFIEADAALKSSDLARTRVLHGKALELFRGIPIRRAGVFLGQLNDLKEALNKLSRQQSRLADIKQAAQPKGRGSKPDRPTSRVIRERKTRARHYVAMIEFEMSLDRIGLVDKLCKGFEDLLASMPAGEFAEEARQLARFKGWVRRNWPVR